VAFALACHLAKLYATYCLRSEWIPAEAAAITWRRFNIRKFLAGFEGRLADEIRSLGGLAVSRRLASKALSPITQMIIYSAVNVKIDNVGITAIPCRVVFEAFCRVKEVLGLYT